MSGSKRPLRVLAAVALLAALASPPVSRAQSGPDPADSPLGVVFAVLCGAGATIARLAPGIPIVVAVTAVSCLCMILDGAAADDH